MLERLRLHNFQVHSDLKIVFDPFVTTVVGPSDVGKSSVIRALRWLTENKPSGDEFVRNGESVCSVVLWADGRRIGRRKGKATNEYVSDGQVLRAFGSDVPEPIANMLQIGRTNFQLQHDAPFWFSLTAGQVSRELNGVVNLDVIDRTMSAVSSALRKARSVEEVCSERLKEAIEQVEGLSWVPEMEGEFEQLKEMDGKSNEMQERMDGIEGCIARIAESRRKASAMVPDLSELEKLKKKLDDVACRENDLLGRLNKVESLRNTIIEKEKERRKLEERLEKEFGGTCPLCGSVFLRKD